MLTKLTVISSMYALPQIKLNVNYTFTVLLVRVQIILEIYLNLKLR